MKLEQSVARHYTHGSLEPAILEALTVTGKYLDRLAPSEVRCRPIAHELVADVLRRTRGAPSPAVADLADNMGLTV